MMDTYKLLKDINGIKSIILRNNRDSIPFDSDNTDYQAYLKWIAEGNIPEAAE